MLDKSRIDDSNKLPERRYPSSRPLRKKRKRQTVSDRLVCGLLGAVLGMVLWTLCYFILFAFALKSSADSQGSADGQPPAASRRKPTDLIPPFQWGGLVALGFAVFGAAVGAERMMDVFEKSFRTAGRTALDVPRS